MNVGCILLEHITRMTRVFVGYWSLPTPARSAPAYEHQLQQNITILGSNSDIYATSSMRPSVNANASITADICFVVKCRDVIAPVGHTSTDLLHPEADISVRKGED